MAHPILTLQQKRDQRSWLSAQGGAMISAMYQREPIEHRLARVEQLLAHLLDRRLTELEAEIAAEEQKVAEL